MNDKSCVSQALHCHANVVYAFCYCSPKQLQKLCVSYNKALRNSGFDLKTNLDIIHGSTTGYSLIGFMKKSTLSLGLKSIESYNISRTFNIRNDLYKGKCETFRGTFIHVFNALSYENRKLLINAKTHNQRKKYLTDIFKIKKPKKSEICKNVWSRWTPSN